MKGAILEKGEDYYTNLGRIFSAINNIQKDYNWLITDFECCNRTVSYSNNPNVLYIHDGRIGEPDLTYQKINTKRLLIIKFTAAPYKAVHQNGLK